MKAAASADNIDLRPTSLFEKKAKRLNKQHHQFNARNNQVHDYTTAQLSKINEMESIDERSS